MSPVTRTGTTAQSLDKPANRNRPHARRRLLAILANHRCSCNALWLKKSYNTFPTQQYGNYLLMMIWVFFKWVYRPKWIQVHGKVIMISLSNSTHLKIF